MRKCESFEHRSWKQAFLAAYIDFLLEVVF